MESKKRKSTCDDCHDNCGCGHEKKIKLDEEVATNPEYEEKVTEEGEEKDYTPEQVISMLKARRRKVRTLQDYKFTYHFTAKLIRYILNYIPISTRTSIKGWQCVKCNYIFSTSYVAIFKKNGTRCKKCAGYLPKTLEDYKSINFCDRQIEYILDYIPQDGTTSIDGWRCKLCGHTWETSYNNIFNGKTGCSRCSGVLKKTLEDYKIINTSDRNIIYFLDYIPQSTDIPIEGWKCVICKKILRKSYTSIYNVSTKCGYCFNTIPKTIDDYKAVNSTDRGIYYFLDYIPENTKTPILGWRCTECSQEWQTSFYCIYTSGSGCRYCGKSKSENLCREIFEKLTGKKFPSMRHPEIINPSTFRKLELDGYSESLRMAFEFSGYQHYIYPNTYHESEEEFLAQKQRDEIKQMRCAELGITLFIIPYQYDYKNPKKLEDYIKSLLDL